MCVCVSMCFEAEGKSRAQFVMFILGCGLVREEITNRFGLTHRSKKKDRDTESGRNSREECL